MTNSINLTVRPLSKSSFSPYGDVIDTEGAEPLLINKGTTERFHDLAGVDVSDDGGHPLINIFRGQAFRLPIRISMMERHPLGSQAFVPISPYPWLVVVAAAQEDGTPGVPEAFIAALETILRLIAGKNTREL